MTKTTKIETLFSEICKFAESYQKSNRAIKTSEKEAKDTVNNLREFAHQVFDSADDEVKSGFTIGISKGMTYMPHILWVAFLPEGHTVSRNMSVAVCFGKYGEGAVAGTMESKGMSHKTVAAKWRTNEPILVDVDGKKYATKYNNMFLNPKEFLKERIDTSELINHISESIVYLKRLLNSE